MTQLGLPAIFAFALFRKHEQSLTAPLAPIWNCERKNKRSMLGKRNTDILEWGKSRWQRTVFRGARTAGSHWRAKTTLWRASTRGALSAQRLTGCQNTLDQLARREFLTLLGGAAAHLAPRRTRAWQERPDR
jgi:hypothetical protein